MEDDYERQIPKDASAICNVFFNLLFNNFVGVMEETQRKIIWYIIQTTRRRRARGSVVG
jgi:hypothetical protein